MRRREFIKSLAGSALLCKAAFAFQGSSAPPEPDPNIRRVLVMFKCHFDAGFIDTQAAVVQRYFKEYFPRAIALAADLRESSDYRYVWTTGSWLLYEYLEQASTAERARMEKAVAGGDIAWHALPFSWQTELMEGSMISGALGLSRSLDRRFGRTTTGAKMTDVPGHTRGLIAPLAANGVKFLHIGVNEASTPPEVPGLFRWQDPDGASLTVMYHHGYGGVTTVPGSNLVIAIVVRDDNSGPHTSDEIQQTYADLGRRFPRAHIAPTSLTEIANAIEPHQSSLPVVTSEIGDTWIHGVSSDPLKLARYREVARLRERWLKDGKLAVADPADIALLRHVLLEAEHTWGTDTKTWLDFDHYTPKDLSAMLDSKNYKVVQFSWQEKRQDLFSGIDTLPPALREEAHSAVLSLEAVEPKPPQSTPSSPKTEAGEVETTHFVVGIDSNSGAIRRLRDKKTGREWASAARPIALFSYQTLSQQDYSRFFDGYVISNEDWAKKDFGKPNIERFGAASREWLPSLAELQVEDNAEGHRLLARLAIGDPDAAGSGRAAFPPRMFLELVLPRAEPVVQLNFSWFRKPATRLPEALWLTFDPVVSEPGGWMLEKSGKPVAPSDVVVSGNRHMHALSKGFGYKDDAGTLFVETLDAPVITLGVKSPLCFSKTAPDLTHGIHCNLFNNAWGTNYIMWFGENMRFRFVLRTS